MASSPYSMYTLNVANSTFGSAAGPAGCPARVGSPDLAQNWHPRPTAPGAKQGFRRGFSHDYSLGMRADLRDHMQVPRCGSAVPDRVEGRALTLSYGTQAVRGGRLQECGGCCSWEETGPRHPLYLHF